MMEHGRDLGTMEFIFAKGGTVADMNYVMFDVQDNSWEPLIKAVAERDNSHPDIIRKEAGQLQQQQQQGALGVPQGFTPGVAVNPQMVVAANPRAVKQANRAMRSAQQGQNVRDGSTNVGDLAGAGFYGQAAMQAGKNIFQGMKQRREDRRAARAADTSKEGGMRQRMGNFMGKVGEGLSNLRHAPAAAKQSFRDSRGRREDEARRNTLETGLGRGSKIEAETERRMVPGSQNFDTNMDRARGAINQQLARDYNINVPTDSEGNPTMTAQDAMRDEIKRIGDRRAQPQKTFFQSMKEMGDERRAGNQAQKEGAAYAPSNVVPEEEPQPPAMPKAPTPEAERAADTDIVPKEEERESPFNFVPEGEGPDRSEPPQDAGKPMEVEPETATATEPDAREAAFREQFGRQGGEKGTGYAMGGKSGKELLGRGMESDIDLSNVDQQLTEQMIQSLGINDNKIGQAIMQRLRALPQYVKEQAAQGDSQAMERVEDEAEAAVEESSGEGGKKPSPFNFQNPDMASEMKDIGAMNLSEDNHKASWDSLLKGLDIR